MQIIVMGHHHRHQGGKGELQKSAKEYNPPDFQQVIERKFHSDGKEQNDHPYLSHQFNLVRGMYNPKQVRPCNHTGQQIADNGGDPYLGKQKVDNCRKGKYNNYILQD